ncbi:MAG TPA: DNA polymerase III subunit delta [Clostridia bacterium]|nr:DNA polymerase III subunit delta [Clostridia bacterium]
MEYRDFFRAIKENTVSGAYLLHGEEEFVKDSALAQLLAKVEPGVREMNVDSIASAGAPEIVAACETLPFLSEMRVVVVRALPKEGDAEELRAYLDRVPRQTALVFFCRGKADGKLLIVKAFDALGRAVYFAPLNESDASRWLRQRADSAGVSLAERDADFFVTIAGTDCARLNNEFQKAAAYAGDGNAITRQIISKVVTRDLEFVVFSVLDDVLSGRIRDGFAALRGLIYDGEEPMEIAKRIGEKARLILQARRFVEKKKSKDFIVENLGVNRGYAYRVYEAARLMKAERTEPLARCAKALCDVTKLQLTGRAKALDALEQALLLLAG